MGNIKAMLVAVCDYPQPEVQSLPLCKRDLFAMQSALIKGLHILPNNILLCNESGHVTRSELLQSLSLCASTIDPDETFMFYFTGHGGHNCVALSDGTIELQQIINCIEKINAKNKVIILDSCYSGGFSIAPNIVSDAASAIDTFAGYGYAVLASCGANEVSGFNKIRDISTYTSFVCDALTSRILIRKGKKSLESISQAIFHYAKQWNSQPENHIQNVVFRENIGGTIFFDIAEYNPYQAQTVYLETDKYIIYNVKPVHSSNAKRLCAEIILRFDYSSEDIAQLTLEIKDCIMYCDVYQSISEEKKYAGRASNIVWCHFGYDEADVVNANFSYCSTWVDGAQDKAWWYRLRKNDVIIDDVHIKKSNYYFVVKNHQTLGMPIEDFVALTEQYSSKLITLAGKYICLFREFQNHTMTELEFIQAVEGYNSEINCVFLQQSNLPIAPIELHEWSMAHTKIACSIHDFSLFYNRKYMHKWTDDSRIWLLNDALKRYTEDLDCLKFFKDGVNQESNQVEF